ncbi:hypothetical protein DQ04_13271020, partial [Trypanosoma grayi]|uniref:hypothetical protein n=1 Tax=Trypanosoma grayi TaxID=71804 RepID=UPI0004F4A6DC
QCATGLSSTRTAMSDAAACCAHWASCCRRRGGSSPWWATPRRASCRFGAAGTSRLGMNKSPWPRRISLHPRWMWAECGASFQLQFPRKNKGNKTKKSDYIGRGVCGICLLRQPRVCTPFPFFAVRTMK